MIKPGSLTVVGTGIQAITQMTVEAKRCAEIADKLLYLVADPVTEAFLIGLNSTAESLHQFYADNKDRFESYTEMATRILDDVRRGLDVCAAFYGHPGVFVFPSHEVVRSARAEGYEARMLPGISAEDCLFADLGIDPAIPGCQSFETTDFLIHNRKFDPTSSLILWQVGVIGDLSFRADGYDTSNINVLVEYLEPIYGRDHITFLYEASHFTIYEPRVERVSLGELARASLTPISTLYVPPIGRATIDEVMIGKLGIRREDLRVVKREVLSGTTSH